MPVCDAFSSPIIQVHQATHLIGRPCAGHALAIHRAQPVPVGAVHLFIEEIVAQVRPRLVEDLELLLREVHVQFGAHRHAAHGARRDIHGL